MLINNRSSRFSRTNWCGITRTLSNSLRARLPARQACREVFLLLIFLASGFCFLTSPAHAQTQDWGTINSHCVGGAQGDVATIRGLECLVANVLTVAVTIIGLGGFVMMIYGSFKYLLSGGNAKGIETARSTITFAIVGLAVALSAYFILNILAEFTGISMITRFQIPEINQ